MLYTLKTCGFRVTLCLIIDMNNCCIFQTNNYNYIQLKDLSNLNLFSSFKTTHELSFQFAQTIFNRQRALTEKQHNSINLQ